jgi:hypothetical protein
MMAWMVGIGRGDPRGGKRVENEGKSRAMEKESGSLGEADLRSPQFRAGCVKTPPAAGCGGRRSPAAASNYLWTVGMELSFSRL